MFVQVVQGEVTDSAQLEKRMQEWIEQLGPDAEGWLGSTGGVTADGTLVMIARFENEEAAAANSQRPEQSAWWAETEKLFEGPVTFRDTTDVTTYLEGGSDDAGFVQIMQGGVTDRSRYEEISERAESQLSEVRPDVIGGLIAWFGDEFVEAVYFTSEADACEGEKRMSEGARPAELEEMLGLMGDVSFYNLTNPALHSPG